MVKLRPKRDRQQRPLLTQEDPMLSDQMPPSRDERDAANYPNSKSYSKSNSNSNPIASNPGSSSPRTPSRQKKASWKRLFGKGGKRTDPDESFEYSIDTTGGGGGGVGEHSQKDSAWTEEERFRFRQPQSAISNNSGHRRTSHANANLNANTNLNSNANSNAKSNSNAHAPTPTHSLAYTNNNTNNNPHTPSKGSTNPDSRRRLSGESSDGRDDDDGGGGGALFQPKPKPNRRRSRSGTRSPRVLPRPLSFTKSASDNSNNDANNDADNNIQLNNSSGHSRSRSFMRSRKKKSDPTAPSEASPRAGLPLSPTTIESNGGINNGSINNGNGNHSGRSQGRTAGKRSGSFSGLPPTAPSSSSPRETGSRPGSSPPKHDVKKILSKPFGREHILMSEQTYVVHISRAEWDPDESQWKYRVSIQRREGNKLRDFATCFTLRSLEDFHWLEESLQSEFFGGLLLPSLSIYLGLPDILSCQHEVDPQLLSNWLSDALNGIRGQGELLLSLTTVDIATSESMEAFFYRSQLLREREPDLLSSSMDDTVADAHGAAASRREGKAGNINNNSNNIFFGGGSGAWSFFPDLCYANCVVLPLAPMKDVTSCHSPSLGTANTFNVRADSFVEPATLGGDLTAGTAHADLLGAERDLIWSWRTRALQAMEKLRLVKEQEKHAGVAWKRFAICISNLFAYEKDIETARVGDSKSRRDLQIPYRRLQKTTVDDCLRILTKHKLERATPSIESIYAMLSAYVADLSTVEPSVAAYLRGLQKLAAQKTIAERMEKERGETGGGAADSPGLLANKIQQGLKVVKKQLTSSSTNRHGSNLDGLEGLSGEERWFRQKQRVQTMENLLLANEALLKDYMTTMCKTAPVRTSRMIYAYLEKEKEQCKALHDAAVDLKQKVNIASKETLSKMVHRHHVETKEDKETELQLVHKIVNIGNARKFVRGDREDQSEEIEKGVELSIETDQEESEKMKRRDKAMSDCRSRIGRWDAKLAMSIMEAVGVTDANVRVEETTRDLRMVRKHAIGLRENVERCTEGLEVLRASILQGSMGDIRDVRSDFVAELENLLSCMYVPVGDQAKDFPASLLEKEGILVSDPAGWKRNDRGSCGKALDTYVETRDSGTEWLLESLGELLKEYSHRVEAIESFVYMECVGIQLEKHFSQARASALMAFEKKTDITSAINIATRKKMRALAKELQDKLENLGPVVSHTTVKEAKEAHLESKLLKQELHTLAMRRLARARETSTERAIAMMTVWSKEEEGSASTERGLIEALSRLLQDSLRKDALACYVDASPARI